MTDKRALTWGEILDALAKVIAEDPEAGVQPVIFDFAWLPPSGQFYCDRGDYARRAIEVGNGDSPEMSGKKFAQLLHDEIGTVREAWKGGDYTCHKHTEVVVASRFGQPSDTRIVGVRRRYYGTLLETKYEED